MYHDSYKLIASQGVDVKFGYELPDETVTKLPSDEYERLQRALPPRPSESHEETEVSGVVEDRLEQLGYK